MFGRFEESGEWEWRCEMRGRLQGKCKGVLVRELRWESSEEEEGRRREEKSERRQLGSDTGFDY